MLTVTQQQVPMFQKVLALIVRILDVHVVMQDKFSPAEKCRRESCTDPIHRVMVHKLEDVSGQWDVPQTLFFNSVCSTERTLLTFRFHLTGRARRHHWCLKQQ